MAEKLNNLVSLLNESKLKVRFNSSDTPRSYLNDLNYKTTLIALTFHFLGKPDHNNSRNLELNSTLLALSQFLASRPQLIAAFETYLVNRKRKQIVLEDSLGLPRGYFIDSLHKDCVNLLLSIGYIKRGSNDALVMDLETAKELSEQLDFALKENCFSSEKACLERLKELNPPLNSLGVR